MLGIALALVYVNYPLRRRSARTHVPWFDIAAAAVGFVTGAYVAVFWADISSRIYDRPLPADLLVVSAIFIVLCLEGLRRTVGYSLLVIVGVFIVYALFGHLVPGELQTHYVRPASLLTYLAIDNNGMFGLPMVIVTTIVITFVFFGHLLRHAGTAEFINDLSLALMGRYRGGSAKIRDHRIQPVRLDLRHRRLQCRHDRRRHYPDDDALRLFRPPCRGDRGGGVDRRPVDAAGDGRGGVPDGRLPRRALPRHRHRRPGAGGPLLRRPVHSRRSGGRQGRHHPRRRGRDTGPGRVLAGGWMHLAPFVAIVVALFSLNWRPEMAAIAASVIALVIGLGYGYKGQRMRLADVWASITATGNSVLDIIMIVAGAGFVFGALQVSGLASALTQGIIAIAGNSLLALLVIAALLCIILGMGMPTVGVYVLLAVLIAPALVEVGIDPLAAHMFILYFGMMSLITPPVAVAAFVAANLAKAPAMPTGWTAMRFGWPAYIVPFLFVFSPSLLLQGGGLAGALDIASAIAGVWLLSAGLIGYFARRLTPAARAAFIAADALLLAPAGIDPAIAWANLAGLILGAAAVTFDVTAARRRPAAGAQDTP